MALRNIVKFGDPILNKTSRKIEKFDDRLAILIDDMLETMYQANGVGLAAVQVGILECYICASMVPAAPVEHIHFP